MEEPQDQDEGRDGGSGFREGGVDLPRPSSQSSFRDDYGQPLQRLPSSSGLRGQGSFPPPPPNLGIYSRGLQTARGTGGMASRGEERRYSPQPGDRRMEGGRVSPSSSRPPLTLDDGEVRGPRNGKDGGAVSSAAQKEAKEKEKAEREKGDLLAALAAFRPLSVQAVMKGGLDPACSAIKPAIKALDKLARMTRVSNNSSMAARGCFLCMAKEMGRMHRMPFSGYLCACHARIAEGILLMRTCCMLTCAEGEA